MIIQVSVNHWIYNLKIDIFMDLDGIPQNERSQQ